MLQFHLKAGPGGWRTRRVKAGDLFTNSSSQLLTDIIPSPHGPTYKAAS